MFGDRFSSSTSCSRWVHETEPDRPDQSLTCCFLKVATHPDKHIPAEVVKFLENGQIRHGKLVSRLIRFLDGALKTV